MDKKHLAMVGNGMAGMKAIEEVLELAPDMYNITIFGAEPHPNYNRILLSTVLAGELTPQDIIIHPLSWYQERKITLHLGDKVTQINRHGQKIQTRNGITVGYDKLILATGSNPFIIPIPGADKEGVIAFRNLADCEKMVEAAQRYRRAAVIGGGLLGLEAAKGLINLGMEVVVIHDQAHLMNMQLDEAASGMLRKELEGQGMQFRLSTLTVEVTGETRVEGLKFSDGTHLAADLVVMAVGIRPNIELARESGLYCNRGVLVNDYLQTITDPSIFAVGECAEHRKVTYGLVAPLYEQAFVLADHITQRSVRKYKGSVVSTKLKVSGVDVFSAGKFQTHPGDDVIEFQDNKGGVYKKVVLHNDIITGAVLFGDTADGPVLFQMMREEKDVGGVRSKLLFGMSSLGDTGHSGQNQAEAFSPDTIVCGCNGVTKQHIMDAIIKQGCTTRREIQAMTKASASCGGCAPLVDQLLASALGASMPAAPLEEPLCPCTRLTHEEVKTEIRTQGFTRVGDAIRGMDWGSEGCAVCRPALNYYIGMIRPETAVDDRFSRAANERMHANIQKDGTFSVIPRIYGGVTTPDELIRIARVAKKYKIPTVKFTGGQRLDLLGVAKENLVSVWRELDMPSGYAYGKALRTVKTCVGNTWCRFGTQESMNFGIELEKTFERCWLPAKLKLAVSACPRNCAEASIKDLGIVGVEGGWELYAGGNGGVKVRAGDLLCTLKTNGEVMETAKAYIQFYRETARHNERTAHWVDRLGLEAVKTAVVTDRPQSQALAQRMSAYLATLTTDPWQERVAAADTTRNNPYKEFQPIEFASKGKTA